MVIDIMNIGKPIKFYSSPHFTSDRIISIGAGEEITRKEYEQTKTSFANIFLVGGIKSNKDDKIVFEVEHETGVHLFIGFAYSRMSIGLNIVK